MWEEMTIIEALGVILIMDLISIFALPYREALNKSFDSPRSDDQIRASVVSSSQFKKMVLIKIVFSIVSVAIFIAWPIFGIIIAVVGYVVWVVKLITLTWAN
jgi:hypothetical protein